MTEYINIGNHELFSGNLRKLQFSRESHLDDEFHFATTNIVIGLGGIGSHVAEILGSISKCINLILIDDDDIEISNLNRTSYSFGDVKKLKVEALMTKISLANPSLNIIPIPRKFNQELLDEFKNGNDTKPEMRRTINDIGINTGYDGIGIFDCRDDDFQDHDMMLEFSTCFNDYNYSSGTTRIYRPAYNGTSITFDPAPKLHPCWGTAGYTIIPSHSIPSRMIALLAVLYSSIEHKFRNSIFKELPLTLDVAEIFSFLYHGQSIRNMTDLNYGAHRKIIELIEMSITHPDEFKLIDISFTTMSGNDNEDIGINDEKASVEKTDF